MEHGPDPAFRTRFPVRWFGGEAPIGQPAEVHVGPSGLTITTDGDLRTWRYEDVRQPRAARHGEPIHLERADGHEVIVTDDPAILIAIRHASPGARHIRPASRWSFGARAGLVIAITAVTLVLLVVFGIPLFAGWVAAAVPVEWEERLGDSLIDSYVSEGRRVTDPRIVDPVEKVVSRLAESRPGPYRYQVVVIDERDVNAMAAPGGRLAVYRGLLEFVRTPEELAGVIAHEMEHVRRRHVTEGILKKASLGLLFSLVAGGSHSPASAGIGLVRALGELSYSREAESEADRGALDWLVAAHVDPRAMPEVLARMREVGGSPRWAEFLATHPAPESRALALRAAVRRLPIGETQPVLSAAEWTALRAAAGARKVR
jgi:beta-barrel assembly-enhancing protease